jgi:hypothetical protein
MMMMRCLVKPKRLFNSMPRAGPRDLTNRPLRYGTIFIDFMLVLCTSSGNKLMHASIPFSICVGLQYELWLLSRHIITNHKNALPVLGVKYNSKS